MNAAWDVTSAPAVKQQRYLINPILDFLCFGGGFLVCLPVLALLPASGLPIYLALTLMLANFINHPHFAASYQVFYHCFPKILRSDASPLFKARTVFSGFGIPFILFAFFSWCIVQKDAVLIGYAVNAMGFLVGWHYVKQGYGLLMVDAGLKKFRMSQATKDSLKLNAYFCWIFFWCIANRKMSTKDYFGIQYVTFDVPEMITIAILAGLCVTSVLVVSRLWKDCGGKLAAIPFNGMTAYLLSCYIWLALFVVNPVVMVFIPAFHSLQYLPVVFRQRLGYERTHKSERPLPLNLALFFTISFGLGYWGFTGLPSLMSTHIFSPNSGFSTSLYFFVIWIFINIHHYFIDSVIWRKENTYALPYLFK